MDSSLFIEYQFSGVLLLSLSMKFNVHFGAISNTCNTLQLCDHCPQILRIVQTAIFIKPSKSDANKN